MKNKNLSYILIACVGIFIGVFLKLFVIDFLYVSGRSMIPIIKDKQRIVVSKLSYGIIKPYSDKLLVQCKKPTRNDVVIYLYNNRIVVKRCVGIEGDTFECERSTDLFNNSLYNMKINGKTIPLTETQYLNLKNINCVPEGYVLAIGDNYEESIDSRNYGFVPIYNILGKVLCK